MEPFDSKKMVPNKVFEEIKIAFPKINSKTEVIMSLVPRCNVELQGKTKAVDLVRLIKYNDWQVGYIEELNLVIVRNPKIWGT